jgi:DNA polymerase III alpha subunit
MRTNYNRQMILNEDDLISSWLGGSDVSSAIFEDNSIINIYNEWCEQYDNEHTVQTLEEDSSEDYPEKCLQNWHMPDEFKNLNLEDYLQKMCSTAQEQQRVTQELLEFKKRGMFPVLQFLIYLVDICRKNKIVLGVGRGSSVASYVLYLIGVHKVDSIKYDLDIKEFLK